MAQLPRCPNNAKGSCERSEPMVLNETEGDFTFYCRCCHCIYVRTKPAGWRRVAMERDYRSKRDGGNRAMYGGRIIVGGGL